MNAFVNAGFGNDPLMVNAEEGQSWVYKNKDSGSSLFSSLVGRRRFLINDALNRNV